MWGAALSKFGQVEVINTSRAADFVEQRLA
jgi:hypothetical protein